MFSASDLRKGLKIEMDGDPYEVVGFQFVKPGKGQAFYKCKLKNVFTSAVTDKTFRSVDKIGKPDIMEKDMTYSYKDAGNYVFMDDETFEQVEVPPELLGEQTNFILEEMACKVLFFNDRPIEITLPNFVEKEITETEPGARGDTATNVSKPAKIDNGYEIFVPIFINVGDIVRIDTRDGKYSDRVSKA
jgi:elongation factor P